MMGLFKLVFGEWNYLLLFKFVTVIDSVLEAQVCHKWSLMEIVNMNAAVQDRRGHGN